MTFLPENNDAADEFSRITDRVHANTNALDISAAGFGKTMSKAFADATTGGKNLDDVLRQLALRLSSMAVTQAFQSLVRSLAGGIGDGLGRIFGDDPAARGRQRGRGLDAMTLADSFGGLTPFASGGVIGTPAYFPLLSAKLGVAGEAGPEAIMPLSRGSDGRLCVALNGAGQAPIVTVHIATPDAESFRRSEAYITGQIARAVARGQRGF
jgi:phage-related minor tail protein